MTTHHPRQFPVILITGTCAAVYDYHCHPVAPLSSWTNQPLPFDLFPRVTALSWSHILSRFTAVFRFRGVSTRLQSLAHHFSQCRLYGLEMA
jgi:hypothetical protein